MRPIVDLHRNCMALAPADWGIYGSTPQGSALDMAAADGRMFASYSIAGVPGVAIRFYSQKYGTPEIAIHNSLSNSGQFPVAYGPAIRDDDFGYTWLPFEIGDPSGQREPHKGVVLYRVWAPLPGDPQGYILVQRRAQTLKSLWQARGAQAIAVALSIRCTVQLQPTENGPGGGDDRAESTYNQQLGMEYAHDPVTGENYWVSPGSDWQDVGPEGPGYYRRSGNDLRKLAAGRNPN